MDLILKVKLLNDEAKLPSYAHVGDVSLDLSSISDIIIPPGESSLINTGICIELPPNTEAQIRPRSGLALYNKITVLNAPGTIENGYRGEIKIILINHGKQPFKVEKGMRIAHMVINPIVHVKVEVVKEISATERGDGGFSSTGL